MKKFFMFLASAAVAMSFVACNGDKKDDDLIDDDKKGEESNLPASLQGSDYFVLVMDGETYAKIENKVTADIRMQDGGDEASTRPLYVWNGYDGGTAEGLNFYGVAGEYMCLVVKPDAGWSGFGEFLKDTDPSFSKMSGITGDYYFHFAYKGAANTVHALYPGWGTKNYQFSVGDGQPFVDNGNTLNFLAPISNDGKFVANEWNEYEIKVSDMGIDFTAAPAGEGGQNIFCGLSGGVAGTTLSLDAVFFYKK